VVGGVPERFALSVHRGDSARITLDPLGGREFLGVIEFVGTMVANVQVERERLQHVIVVPQQVVLRTEDGYQVYVVADRDGYPIASAREVELGPSYGNRIVIAAGLEIGEQLITVGQRLVDEGSFVRVVSGSGGNR
jgi:multidrug efflux pump subunit AcrA (membrane-fusion protein)